MGYVGIIRSDDLLFDLAFNIVYLFDIFEVVFDGCDNTLVTRLSVLG